MREKKRKDKKLKEKKRGEEKENEEMAELTNTFIIFVKCHHNCRFFKFKFRFCLI